MAETDDKESRELAIRLLLEEYKARGDEIKEFNQRYHQQTSYLYVLLSAIIAIAIAGIKSDKDASASVVFFGTHFEVSPRSGAADRVALRAKRREGPAKA